MAKKGKKFIFHGAFTLKAEAKKKEKHVKGFILDRTIKGRKRHVVVTRRKK